MGRNAENMDEASLFPIKGLSEASDKMILSWLSFLFKESVLLSSIILDYDSLIPSIYGSESVSSVYLLNEIAFSIFGCGIYFS